MNEFNAALLRLFLDRFCNRYDVYASQCWDSQAYRYQPRWMPVTTEHVKSHLQGDQTIGWYCSSPENLCKWMVFDFDDQKGNRQRLAQLMRQFGWHAVLEGGRRGRDGHIWLFFDAPVPAFMLRQLGKLFIRTARIPDSTEIFPKQDYIANLGNLVRSPLGIHRKPDAHGERGWFDELNDHDLNHQLEWFAQQPLNKATTLMALAEQLDVRNRVHQLSSNPQHASVNRTSSQIDFALYAKHNNFRQNGNYYSGSCPSCKLEGRDQTDDHLSISTSGSVRCWRGCSFQQIVGAAKNTNTS